MKRPPTMHRTRMWAVLLLATAAGGCGLVAPVKTPPPSYYSLDSAVPAVRPGAPAASAPTLIVNPTRAAAGFDSKHMIYTREPHRLERFAHSEWIDPPARILPPLIAKAVEGSGAFRAVVLTPSAAAGDLRLDSEIVRLQHDFGSTPSHVRFTLRATIVDNATRKVIAWRELDETSPAAGENPYGGVLAANVAVQAVLSKLAAFCAETAGSWSPAAGR